MKQSETVIIAESKNCKLVVGQRGIAQPNKNTMLGCCWGDKKAWQRSNRVSHFLPHTLRTPPILTKPFVAIAITLWLYARDHNFVRVRILARRFLAQVAVINNPT